MVYVGFKANENVNTTISVLNMTGAVLMNKTFSNVNGNFVTEFNVGNLAKGTYMIKIDSDKGKYARRIVVE